MPWSLSVCSCDIAPPLLVFPWLEFPSQLPVVQMNAVREFAVFFQDPCDKISAGAPEEDWSPWGSQHGPFSSVQPGMGGVGVPWGWGGESSCLSQGGRGPVACLPGQGFQPAVRNQWCQWNLPTPMKSFPVMLNLSRRFLSMAKRAVLWNFEINQVMAHLCWYLSNEAKSLQFSRTHQYRWEGFS